MTEQQNELRRSKRQRPFTQIDNEIVNNSALTWQAKGMLAYLLSKPDGWTFFEDDLVKRSDNGKSSVRSILKELLETGYLIRGERMRDENGYWKGYPYTVEPYLVDDYDGKSYLRFSKVGNSKVGKSKLGKSQDISNTKSFSNTNISSNTKNNSNSNTEQQEPEQEPYDDNSLNTETINAFKKYEQEIGVISPSVIDRIDAMIKDVGEELVVEAINRAAYYNKRSLGYVDSIVMSWLKHNLKTLSDVQAHEGMRGRQVQGGMGNGTHQQQSTAVAGKQATAEKDARLREKLRRAKARQTGQA